MPDAEAALLGAILSGYPHVEELSNLVRPGDFLQPRNESIFRAALTLAQAGKVPDPILVRAEMGDEANTLPNGPLHLSELASAAPVVQSAPYYAAEVAEAALSRRVETAGLQIQEVGRSDLSTDEKVERAKSIVDAAVDTARQAQHITLGSILPDVMDIAQHGRTRGLGTQWGDLDKYISGVTPGRLIVVGARPGIGKALALDTPIPTPSGWINMGAIQVGDTIFAQDGSPTRVTNVSETWADRNAYLLTFDDDSRIVADENHEWFTRTRAERRAKKAGRVRDTAEIVRTLRCGSDARSNHSIPTALMLEGEWADLPLDPYVLGIWLGDGSSRGAQVTTPDTEVVEQIRLAGYPCRKLSGPYLWSLSPGPRGGGPGGEVFRALRELNLLGNKHIPTSYLRASPLQRLALLQGLMDSDGYVNRSGTCQFAVTSSRLAEDFYELAVSLGIKAGVARKVVAGSRAERSVSYAITFTTALPVCRVQRKAERQNRTVRPTTLHRYVVAAEPVVTSTRCIEVDHPSHMFLAGKQMIPTHNSVMGTNLALRVAHRHQQPVYLASMEMPREEVGQRLIASHARVNLSHLEHGQMTVTEWEQFDAKAPELQAMPITIEDAANQSLASIRLGLRNLIRLKGPVPLVVVDYLQLMKARDPKQNRAQQLGEITAGLKVTAREFNTCIVAMAQLNRESTHGTPGLQHLRESGSIEADADIVILLHRPDEDIPELEGIIAKNRSGPLGKVHFHLMGQYATLASASG